MFKRLGRFVRFLFVLAVLGVFLLLYRPDFVNNAGNAVLNSIGSATAYGSAEVIPGLQDKGGDLQVTLQGLTSQFHYVVALEEGRCGGKVLKTFNSIQPDTNGSATASYSLSDLKAVNGQGIWVDVHQGTDASGPSVACGQVQINSDLLKQSTSSSASDSSSTGSVSTSQVTSSSATYSNVVGISNSGTGDTRDIYAHSGLRPAGFPQTGVAPAHSDSYDNYTYPRKY